MVDWNKPDNASNYSTGVLDILNDKIEGAATMDFTGDTNVPTGAIRWNATSGALERWSGSAWTEVYPMPTNYIGGLRLDTGADRFHDINVTPGSCRDATDAVNMRLLGPSALVKQIDAAWAVGTNQGGLDTGTVAADTLYAVWLIKRSDTGVVDALISASFTAPTMPTNYDYKRLIGAVLTNGSADLLEWLQAGDYFRYIEDVVTDVNDNTITSVTWETATLSAPPWSLVHIYAALDNPTTTGTEGRLHIRTVASNDDATSGTEAVMRVHTASAFDGLCSEGMCLIDNNRQLQYAALESDGTATVTIKTFGFLMLSRREPQ